MGVIVGSLSVLPIAVAAWMFGRSGGLLAGLLSIPLHIVLFTLGGSDGWAVVLQQWPGSVMGIVLGVSIGWISTFLTHVKAQARELAEERAALRAEIIERERVEHALQQAKADAEAANRAKSAFLANMSHELRTPLTAIIGYCDLLLLQAQHGTPPDLTADLEQIAEAGRDLLAQINDVLDLSKIEAGKIDIFPEAFALPALIREVSDTTRPLLQRNGNRLQMLVADDASMVYLDRTKLRRVLLNLLSNAAKFTTGGTITLEVEYEQHHSREPQPADPGAPPAAYSGDWIIIRVGDTGIGMTEEQLQNLFQPFTQATPQITQMYGGTGLGLALSQRFCALMGGTITATSDLGVGSAFSVRLPASYADPATPACLDPPVSDDTPVSPR
jgi:signal transduction histidine kinase